jgi:hypothetical protein
MADPPGTLGGTSLGACPASHRQADLPDVKPDLRTALLALILGEVLRERNHGDGPPPRQEGVENGP